MLVSEIRTERAVIRVHDDSVQPDQTEKILEMIAARALAAFQTVEKTARAEERKNGFVNDNCLCVYGWHGIRPDPEPEAA